MQITIHSLFRQKIATHGSARTAFDPFLSKESVAQVRNFFRREDRLMKQVGGGVEKLIQYGICQLNVKDDGSPRNTEYKVCARGSTSNHHRHIQKISLMP